MKKSALLSTCLFLLLAFARTVAAGENGADFTATDIQFHQDGGLTRVTGVLANHTNKDYTSPRLLLEFFDKKGKVIATASPVLDEIKAKETAEFISIVIGRPKGWKITRVSFETK